MIRMIPIVVLVLVLSSASNAFAVEAEEILARMEIAHSGLRDMKASFIHVREAPLFEEKIESKGELYFREPESLLLRYADPDSNVVLISGGILWLYYPSLRQAHRYEIEPKSSLPGLFLALQGKLEGLEEKFRVAAEDGEREQGYATEVLLLYPLEGTVLAEEVEMIRLVIRKSDSLPVRTEFREITGDRTLFEFFDVQKNPGLDAGIFRFVPPEGTEVFEVEGERW
jgi:outer membrane lipoprotein carrier protein